MIGREAQHEHDYTARIRERPANIDAGRRPSSDEFDRSRLAQGFGQLPVGTSRHDRCIDIAVSSSADRHDTGSDRQDTLRWDRRNDEA